MEDTADYRLVPGPPTLEGYRRLRTESGLSPRSPEESAGALANSWSWCHVLSGDAEAVAMGRVLGDGGWYFVIADIAVLPAHQRRGLGARVLGWLLSDIGDRAPGAPYVTLMADPPGRSLYERFGFRDVAPMQTGMRLDRPDRAT